MSALITKDDPTWETVLEILAKNGALSRFYRVPRSEVISNVKLYSKQSALILAHLYAKAASNESVTDLESSVETLPSALRNTMIFLMVRSMRCWVETDVFKPSASASLWKVAHS